MTCAVFFVDGGDDYAKKILTAVQVRGCLSCRLLQNVDMDSALLGIDQRYGAHSLFICHSGWTVKRQ